jgi:hypothetical protein
VTAALPPPWSATLGTPYGAWLTEAQSIAGPLAGNATGDARLGAIGSSLHSFPGNLYYGTSGMASWFDSHGQLDLARAYADLRGNKRVHVDCFRLSAFAVALAASLGVSCEEVRLMRWPACDLGDLRFYTRPVWGVGWRKAKYVPSANLKRHEVVAVSGAWGLTDPVYRYGAEVPYTFVEQPLDRLIPLLLESDFDNPPTIRWRGVRPLLGQDPRWWKRYCKAQPRLEASNNALYVGFQPARDARLLGSWSERFRRDDAAEWSRVDGRQEPVGAVLVASTADESDALGRAAVAEDAGAMVAAAAARSIPWNHESSQDERKRRVVLGNLMITVGIASELAALDDSAEGGPLVHLVRDLTGDLVTDLLNPTVRRSPTLKPPNPKSVRIGSRLEIMVAGLAPSQGWLYVRSENSNLRHEGHVIVAEATQPGALPDLELRRVLGDQISAPWSPHKATD